MADDDTEPAASWADAALALALPGLSPEAAFALREGRAWRHFPSPDPHRLAGLLCVADLDAHLRTEAARAPRLSLADERRAGSAAVPEGEWALADGRVDLTRLLARFDAGATLVLSQFHETHAGLARLCRGLERVLLHAVRANVYLTPAAAQGFRPHHDTHDVLALQVEGRKRWRVWPGEPVVERPTRRMRWAGGPSPEGEPTQLLLEPGGALFVPRGAVHEAAALPGERSLHVTLGLLEPSWAQAMRALLDALELGDARLRDSVPTWRIGARDLGAALAERAARRGAAGAERLAPLLLGELARDRPPLPARGLFAPFPAGAPLRLHEGMHAHLLRGPAEGEVVAALHWAGAAERLSAAEAAWVEALAEGAAVPEGCEALARRLWAWGLVEGA